MDDDSRGVVFIGTLLFHIIKKNKTYSLLTVISFAILFVFYALIIKDALYDYKYQSISIETGTIQHNVSDSFINEDITFYPSNSNESIRIENNVFADVDCPYGEFNATIVYAEKSKVLLYVDIQDQSDESTMLDQSDE